MAMITAHKGEGELFEDEVRRIARELWPTGQWKKLRDLRFRGMEPIRNFHRETPHHCGVLTAGRAHFFDSAAERRTALNPGDRTVSLTLSDFSEQQIERYLRMFGIEIAIPSWLPRRPLLLGYLAAKRLLGDVILDDQSTDAAAGWDLLLDRITNREAGIEAGIDGATLRRVIERIATKARCTPSGLGPIYQRDLADAFFEICGYHPNDAAMVLLQRLPGLGVHSGAEESRSFIHEDLTDVCRVGDLLGFIIDPFSFSLSPLENLECLLGEIGQEVLARKIGTMGISRGKLEAAIRILELREKCAAPIADLTLTAIKADIVFIKPVYVKHVVVESLDLTDLKVDQSHIYFQDCLLSDLELNPESGLNYPHFFECYIGRLIGRVSAADLPPDRFDVRCVIEQFEHSTSTTREIMCLPLPDGTKVLLSVLRKLYIQKGSGRRDNAFIRGLDERARRVVPEVLHILKSNNLAYPARHGSNHVWYPIRSQTKRVFEIINSPITSSDPILRSAAELVS